MNFFGLWPGEWLEDDEEAASPPPQPREHVSPRSPSRQRDSPRRQELSAPEWDDDFGMAFPAQEKPSKHYVHSVRKKTRTRHSPDDDIEQQNSSESADTLRPVREDSMEVNCTAFFMDGECAQYYVDEEDLEVLSIQVQVPKKSSLKSSRCENESSCLSSLPPTNTKADVSFSSTTQTETSESTDSLEDDEEPLDRINHISFMSFGHGRTWTAIVSTFLGLVLAILSKRSLHFVTLESPLVLSPHFNEITAVGLVRLQMCYNDTFVGDRRLFEETVSMPYLNAPVTVEEDTPAYEISSDSCYTIRLTATLIEDTMWDVARISTSMAIALGSFFCIMMITTIYWESINMKPIAIGLLVTYLCQSFSFFFFDSQLCREYGCSIAQGTVMSVIASFCWFVSAMSAILMDVHYMRKMRRLAHLERRRQRRLRKRRLQRETSLTTTEHTSSVGSSSQHSAEGGLVETVPQKECAHNAVWQV